LDGLGEGVGGSVGVIEAVGVVGGVGLEVDVAGGVTVTVTEPVGLGVRPLVAVVVTVGVGDGVPEAVATAVGVALGETVADALAIPTPGVFAQACSIGMTAAAAELYQHLDALEDTRIELVAHGAARGIDLDGDGHMDGITTGTWAGTIGPDGAMVNLAGSTFEGTRQ